MPKSSGKPAGDNIYTDTSGSSIADDELDILINIYVYPDGSSEGVAVDSPRRPKGTRQASTAHKGFCRNELYYSDEDLRRKNLDRKISRARAAIRRYARQYELKRLFTFTNGGMQGGWTTCFEALEDFGRFMKVHGDALKLKPSIVIVEIGSKGRIHIHCLMQDPKKAGKLDFEAIGEKWTVFLEKKGYISDTCKHEVNKGNSRGSASKASGYISKHLRRAYEDASLSHRQRYRMYGMNKPEPTVTTRVSSLDEAIEFCPDGVTPLFLTSDSNYLFGAVWDTER